MNRKYTFIVLTYIAMQLSVFIGMPLFYVIGTKVLNIAPKEAEIQATGYWLVFSFLLGLAIVLFLLRNKERQNKIERAEPLPLGISLAWAVGGIFLAFFAQILAVSIENMIGVKPGSENTQEILQMIELFPAIVLISSIIGPILEEIVFRKVIFGTLYNRLPFGMAAVISSIIFAFAHMEPVHLILYTAMGFVFAFLYVKTKRIIVPIIAHVMMNTLVVVAQRYIPEDLEKNIQSFIHLVRWMGGFIS
ncbi:CPBP family intramembrane metalloprotease [Siminovitchia acidinfaciens]|uniref:CPBP family intramembrane metalloprotease n=1 Tax=Siminovitchia acidinfaciens TaxID=2321395 RepID=A0A429XWS0_9BACI|nr:type II CAAX endopeptidase family protein [Siminovitchia acidinfaciens]RST72834.1 CPBP family intramembrane metalloprotease [Siminovitchia acidinfaciens]VEF49437.1 putative membrane protease [Bacillus freudenreichii]